MEEELDKKFNAVFHINEVNYKFTLTSLGCISQQSKFRIVCVKIMVNKWFDRFVTLCIILNSLLLASKEYDDNYDASYKSNWNEILDMIDNFFTIIFLFECIVKIIAMGFIKHKNAYLRDYWNWMDFFIVIISVVSLTPGADQSSLKAFRTARILRPLRSMH